MRLNLWLLASCFVAVFGVSAVAEEKKGDTKPYGLTKRVAWTTSRVAGTPEPPPPYEAKRIYPKLKLKEPVFIAQEPGSDRVVVAQLNGKIFAFSKEDSDVAFEDDNQTVGEGSPELFLETGRQIYAFSFHPDYEKNGQIFVFSPTDPDDEAEVKMSRVSRFTADLKRPRSVDPTTEEVIIEWVAGGHNGGEAIIGPDGYLYICTGDGTSDSDGNNSGQGVDDLHAVMIRIDVEHPGPGKAYSIPKDNPFIHYPGARPEIWAFGFRNPWRMSFDPVTGRPWVGDVGQDLWEMIRLVERGGNYGWSVQEGSHPFRPDRKLGPGPVIPPVIEHHHSEARSITGGYVYEGEKFPELRGAYFYGDYEYGQIWALRYDGQKVTWHEQLADTPLRPPGFAVTRDGEILILDHLAGDVYSLERSGIADQGSKFPRKLSQTGLFASVADHVPAPGVIPFSVNVPAWHDGARAERFLAMPGTAQITFVEQSTDANTWKFEDGTVTVQTLSVDTAGSGAATPQRIETRIVVKQQNQWLGYTYLWNEEQTDAVLVDAEGTELTLAVKDPSDPQKTVQQLWRVPGRNECMGCHSRAAGFVLGLNTLQINGDHDYGTVVDNQLRAFDHVGLFTEALNKPADDYAALPKLDDETADLTARARAYFYVNCSVCHSLAGGGNAQLELRFETAPEKTKLFVEPLHEKFGLDGAAVVKEGDPYASVLFYRMATMGRGRMPRIASNVPHDEGLDLIHEWIRALDDDGDKSPLSAEEAADLQTLRAGRSAPPEARAEAARRLLRETRGALILYRLLTSEPVTAEVRQEIVGAAVASPDVNVRDLFDRFVPPEQRRKRLGTNIDTEQLLAISGDATRGRESFLSGIATQCKSCHRIENVGGTVGADLNEIGKKYTRPQILEAILNPSKDIDPKFTAFVLTTTGGKVFTGILVEKSDVQVVLKDAKDELIRVPADEVGELLPQKQSLMPEQLLRDFTPQQAADLLEYLTTLK